MRQIFFAYHEWTDDAQVSHALKRLPTDSAIAHCSTLRCASEDLARPKPAHNERSDLTVLAKAPAEAHGAAAISFSVGSARALHPTLRLRLGKSAGCDDLPMYRREKPTRRTAFSSSVARSCARTAHSDDVLTDLDPDLGSGTGPAPLSNRACRTATCGGCGGPLDR